MNQSSHLKVLIPVGGKGSRSGMTRPKTLAKVDGVPIIVQLLRTVQGIDSLPAIIVSPQGKEPIAQTLCKYNLKAEFLVQVKPRGMGDAVLQLKNSIEYETIRNVLVIWGDQPFIQRSTLDQLIDLYKKSNCILAFPSMLTEHSYTIVERDRNGEVIALLERREIGEKLPRKGERDAGIFLFQKTMVMEILNEELEELKGKFTGEKGFLTVIKVLVKRGYTVKAFPIATELDVCGYNTLEDLQEIRKLAKGKNSL